MTNASGSNAWLVEQTLVEVVRLMHYRHGIRNKTDSLNRMVQSELNGQVDGLLWALCLLKGWDPVYEPGQAERVDNFIRVWHNLPGHCTEDGCGAW